MNIFGNVERRAELAFNIICNQFGVTANPDNQLAAKDSQGPVTLHLNYHAKRQFFSRTYKLDISFNLLVNGVPNGRADWRKGKKWVSSDPALSAWLNQTDGLSSQLQKLDTEQAYFICADENVSFHIRPIPGCFIWTLLPPMHYFVRLKNEEVSLISELPNYLLPSHQ